MRRRLSLIIALAALIGACASTPPQDSGPAPAAEAPIAQAAAPDFAELPVDALRAVAAEIERQIAEGNREPTLSGPEGLVVDTPTVRQGVRTRSARVELLNAMLDSGHAWERRNGRIWVLRTADYKTSTTSRQRDINAIMINGENSDRWAIYEGIIDANRLGRGALSDIEEIFFDARLTQMKPGQKYENSDGEQAAIAAAQ